MAPHLLAGDGPPEIVILIVEACESLSDVLALTSTCRAMHHIGRAHAVAHLWSELDGETPCLEEALIAVRMTELVADAERRGVLPPLRFSPGELSRSRRRPTIPELQAALALSRLVSVLELAIRRTNPFTPGVTFLRWLPDYPLVVKGREWQARVHKAIYRVLISAAALAGAYIEPLFAAKSRPGLELTVTSTTRGQLSERQLEFLEQFAVCNMNPAPAAEEDVFGTLGSWLLETILSDRRGREAMAKRFDEGYGRALYCKNRVSCPVTAVEGGNHSDAHFVAWEIMQMLWVREHLSRSVSRQRPAHDAGNGPFSADKNREDRSGTASTAARAVFFGVFQTEEVDSGDLDPEGAPNPFARLAYIPAQDATRYELEPIDHNRENMLRPVNVWGSSTAIFFPWIRGCSGRPNWNLHDNNQAAGSPVAPLANKFFEYFLRRHLGLRLLSSSFDNSTDPSYLAFLGSLAIFAHDDVLVREPYKGPNASVISDASYLDGTELLTKSDPPAVRVFRHQSDWFSPEW
ncbi:uncharacterized protein P884DRAFT_210409 [Thermothelomyces heterothallicus CBS 202.75]|uniref:uncharacterized protein n=1 Tax=Thermothelomyces heterothallicus CBS 202.75 TaxID=1149848 RepID=UPI003743C4FF